MACQKSLAEFYPQGVRGIRKAAEPPAAAQAARRRQIILIINRRDMRVAIYSSRFARVAAANGGKARSEVRSPKIKGIPSIGWDPFDFNLDNSAD